MRFAGFAALAMILLGCTIPSEKQDSEASTPFKITYWTGGGPAPMEASVELTVYSNGTATRKTTRGTKAYFRSVALPPKETESLRSILRDMNISSLNSSYDCRKADEKSCPADFPVSSLNITFGAVKKRIDLYTPPSLPPALDSLLAAMHSIDRKIGAERGEFCGGIAAIKCAEGLICELGGNFPDAGGVCVEK